MKTIKDKVKEVVHHHKHKPERLLEILHDLQDKYLWLSSEILAQVGEELGLPYTKVYGVTSFYSFFNLKPVGQFNVLFSDNITDRHQGSIHYANQLKKELWVEEGHSPFDDLVSIGTTSCTGMCDQGPALLVNQIPITHLNSERIREIAQLILAKKPLHEWPQDWFKVENNIHRKGPLLNSELEPGSSLRIAKLMGATKALELLSQSQLRGRGGAGFPTATKWESCRNAPVHKGQGRVIICNADEGEPGTFKDRVLLDQKADLLIEGMTLAAQIVGAKYGFIYLRNEYKYLKPKLEAALAQRRSAGLLGLKANPELVPDGFDIEIRLGAGAYVCGEETALIESLEGKRGTPRIRPPFPVTFGYLGQPTVVNNVETFCCSVLAVANGADSFKSFGTQTSSGTKLISVSGDCTRPGIYEFSFGTSVSEILTACGAQNANCVQIGGPCGITLNTEEFNRRIGFEDLPTAGSFMVFDKTRNVFEIARQFTHFFAHESCGFCTPCRVGSHILSDSMNKLAKGYGSKIDLKEIQELSHLLQKSSHCGLGQAICKPILDTIHKFPGDYHPLIKHDEFNPAFDLDSSLSQARQLTHRQDENAHLEQLNSFSVSHNKSGESI